MLSLACSRHALPTLTPTPKNIVLVGPNEAGVVLSPDAPEGYLPETLKPGQYTLKPGEQVVLYDLSIRTLTMTETGDIWNDHSKIRVITQDGLAADVSASIEYSIDPERVLLIHAVYGNHYEHIVVRGASIGAFYYVIGDQYTYNDLFTKHGEVETSVFDYIQRVFEEDGLILYQVSISNIELDTTP